MDMTQLHALELLEQGGFVTRVEGVAKQPTFRPTMLGYHLHERQEEFRKKCGRDEKTLKKAVKEWAEELSPTLEVAERVTRIAEQIFRMTGG